MTNYKTKIEVGDKVVLTCATEDSGQEGMVVKILADGDLEILFDDGEEGCYRTSEVEMLEEEKKATLS